MPRFIEEFFFFYKLIFRKNFCTTLLTFVFDFHKENFADFIKCSFGRKLIIITNNVMASAKNLCKIISRKCFRFLYKGIIIKHNKTEPTYTKTSLFLCEKRRFFMARTEKGVVATI